MDGKQWEDFVSEVTARAAKPEHAHMIKPWEMVFGGLILPIIAEVDEAVKAHPKFAELMEKYSKENVSKFFESHEIEKVKELVKIVEKPVVETKIVEKIITVDTARKPMLHDTVEVNGKFRRLKDTVNKIARKKNDIPPAGRDAINEWWNKEQRLTKDGDCQPIADEINKWGQCQPLSAAQVSGWISWLCRLALKSNEQRGAYVIAAMKRGKFSVAPHFTPKFIDEIAKNKELQANDEAHALAAKLTMKAQAKDRVKVMQPQTTQQPTTTPSP